MHHHRPKAKLNPKTAAPPGDRGLAPYGTGSGINWPSLRNFGAVAAISQHHLTVLPMFERNFFYYGNERFRTCNGPGCE